MEDISDKDISVKDISVEDIPAKELIKDISNEDFVTEATVVTGSGRIDSVFLRD